MKRRSFILHSLILFAIVLTGCKTTPPEASADAQRFDLKGKIVSFDKNKMEVTIAHEPIPDYMDAMTMPFTLRDEWVFDVLAPGATIQATLIVDGGKSWIENPTVTQVADPQLAQNADAGVEPEVGAELPDFSLVNQAGKKIKLSQYRGRTLVLTFIYTRCPLPDYCPLMSRNFAEIQKGLPARTQLLSISIDPAYDTPQVLREYGLRYLPNEKAFQTWEFATGSAEEVQAVAKFFGLSYWQENDQIIHGLRTAIVSPEGKLVKVYHGNEWKPAEILAALGTKG